MIKNVACVRAQLYLTFCDPMDSSLPGSSFPGISQARILDWVAFLFLEDFRQPGIKPMSPASPALAGMFFTTSATWEAHD